MENEQEQNDAPVVDRDAVHKAEYAWADGQVDYPHLQQLAREAHLID